MAISKAKQLNSNKDQKTIMQLQNKGYIFSVMENKNYQKINECS